MEKCLFIYNPQSGKCKIKEKEGYIVKRLSEKFEVEVKHSEFAGNIGQTIRARGEEFDIIVGAGGDGTLNEIVDAIMSLEKKPKLGYIPTGTVNDVTDSLSIPKKLPKALDNILKGETFHHDVMKINDRYGIYVCCAGLFTEASYATGQSVKKKMGKLAYFFHGAKGLFTTRAIKLKLKHEGGEIEGRFAIMLLINSRYTAGMKINKKAALNDGLVDVMLVDSKKDKVSFFEALRVMFMFLRGFERYIGRKHFHHFLVPSLSVEIEPGTTINLDGEKISSGSFKAEMIKEGIEIIVPKKEKLTKQIKNI